MPGGFGCGCGAGDAALVGQSRGADRALRRVCPLAASEAGDAGLLRPDEPPHFAPLPHVDLYISARRSRTLQYQRDYAGGFVYADFVHARV